MWLVTKWQEWKQLMINQFTEQLLAEGESARLEYRAALEPMSSIAQTVCAFLNTQGGVVLVGVDDDGEPNGSAHQWSHLEAEGVVDGDELVCTAHFWRFDGDGRGTKLSVKGRRDDKADIRTFAVREVDGAIEVEVGSTDPAGPDPISSSDPA